MRLAVIEAAEVLTEAGVASPKCWGFRERGCRWYRWSIR